MLWLVLPFVWVVCLKDGLGSALGVGCTATRFAAGVWKKLETEGFWDAESFWDGVPFCCVSGGEPVSTNDSQPESM